MNHGIPTPELLPNQRTFLKLSTQSPSNTNSKRICFFNSSCRFIFRINYLPSLTTTSTRLKTNWHSPAEHHPKEKEVATRGGGLETWSTGPIATSMDRQGEALLTLKRKFRGRY